MINFDSLPKDKPSQNNISNGTFTAVVFDAKMMVSKTTNNEYLNVSFKVDDGGFVNENYFESDKPFLLWKLSNLLKACGVQLEGEGSLKDVAKVIKGKKVIIDVAVNDRGYGALDYSGNNEGIYPIGGKSTETETTVTAEQVSSVEDAAVLDADVEEAVEADLFDEDF